MSFSLCRNKTPTSDCTIIIIVYYATNAANINTQLHVQEQNFKKFKKALKLLSSGTASVI